jgi:hypothetical protein
MSNPSHLKLVGPRPGELFSDPTVTAIWAALLTLDVALQHEFLARLRDRLAVPGLAGGTHAVRIARLVAATREAEGMLLAAASAAPDFDPTAPSPLTEDAYEALRKVHREFGWPPASTMRSWVQGGWNNVLQRALLSSVDGGDAVFTTSCLRFCWDEVSDAVRAFLAYRVDQGHPEPTDFGYQDIVNWAKLPHVLALPGRRPRSQSPFDNYGGFLAVKAAALAGDGPPDGAAPRRDGLRSGKLRPTCGYGYERAELVAAVDEVVAYRDGSVPRSSEFKRARRSIIDAERLAGLPARAFPAYESLINTWKSWDAVLVAGGYPPFREVTIDPETERGMLVGPRNHISDSDLFAGLLEAFEQRGKPFRFGVYVDYVKSHGRYALSGRRLASYPCIYGRYRDVAGARGPFKYACDLALPAGWDQPDA